MNLKAKTVFLSAFLLAAGCSKTPEQKVQELFDKGSKQLSEFHVQQADSTFKKINEIDPDSPWGIYGEALTLQTQMKYYDALSLLLKLSDAKPEFTPAHLSAFEIFTDLGFHEDAMTSVDLYSRALKDDPSTHYLIGRGYLNLGYYEKGRLEFKLALEKKAENQNEIQLLIAQAFLKEGSLDSARTYYEAAFGRAEKSGRFYCYAADFAETQGQIDSAMVLSRMSRDYGKDDFTWLVRHFRRLLHNGYFFEARQVMKQLGSYNAPENVKALFLLEYAIAANDKMLIRQAGQPYNIADPNSLSRIVYEIDSRGRIDDLLSVNQEFGGWNVHKTRINFSPRFSEFFSFVMIKLYNRYEMSYNTLQLLEGIGGLRTNSREVKLPIALTKHICGLFEESLNQLAALENHHVSQPDWLVGVADIYRHQGLKKYDEAERIYRQVLRDSPWYYPAFYGTLVVMDKQELYSKKLELFTEYDYLEKNNPAIALDKAKTLLQNGQYNEALALFEEKVASSRAKLSRFTEFIELLAEKGRPLEEQERVLKLMVELNPDNADALAYQAAFEVDHGRYQEALATVEKAQAKDSALADSYVHKARALQGLGQRDAALDAYEATYTQFRDNALVCFYFSRFLAEQRIDFDRAANMGRESVFASFGDPEHVLNLSYIYFLMGRFDLSRGEAMKARVANKENPVPYFRVGLAAAHETREDSRKIATENLNKALELGLTGADRELAEKTLSGLN